VGRGVPLAVSALLLAGLAVPSSAEAMTVSERRAGVLHYTNKARAAAGCAPLVMSSRLKTSAQRHASDMAANDYFSHTSLSGATWIDRIRAVGAKPGAENIAEGILTPKAVVSAWMHSAPHRRNIRDCRLKKLGVGYTTSGHYWVQDFGY
jgi:uncharacterized protein YkwD